MDQMACHGRLVDLQFHPEEVLVEVTLQNLIAEVDKKLPQR